MQLEVTNCHIMKMNHRHSHRMGCLKNVRLKTRVQKDALLVKFNSTICSVFSICRCCTVSTLIRVEKKEMAMMMPSAPPARDLEEASAPRSCCMRETKQKGTFWKDSGATLQCPCIPQIHYDRAYFWIHKS